MLLTENFRSRYIRVFDCHFMSLNVAGSWVEVPLELRSEHEVLAIANLAGLEIDALYRQELKALAPDRLRSILQELRNRLPRADVSPALEPQAQLKALLAALMGR